MEKGKKESKEEIRIDTFQLLFCEVYVFRSISLFLVSVQLVVSNRPLYHDIPLPSHVQKCVYVCLIKALADGVSLVTSCNEVLRSGGATWCTASQHDI
jgi:hypothetical protein